MVGWGRSGGRAGNLGRGVGVVGSGVGVGIGSSPVKTILSVSKRSTPSGLDRAFEYQ